MAASNRVPLSVVSPLPSGDTTTFGGLDFRTYQKLKNAIHRDLLDKVDLHKVFDPDDQTRSQVFAVVQNVVSRLKVPFGDPERERLALEILDEVFRLGPLEPLMQDTTISDILINGAKAVYVERAGVLEETEVMFKDDVHLMHIIQKIVSAAGRRIDLSSPMVDARSVVLATLHLLRSNSWKIRL